MNAFWQHFDSAYLADFADRLVAIQHNDLGFRLTGTTSGRQAADLIAAEMQKLGLAEVRQEPFPVHAWDFQGASLDLTSGESFKASSFAASIGTPESGLMAEMVAVGHGTAQDYLGQDVRGKIVLIHLDLNRLPWVSSAAHEAELHGAAGVVVYYANGKAQHESGLAFNCEDGALRQVIPVIQIRLRDGAILAEKLAQGPVMATLHCHVTNDHDATGYNVVGLIRGSVYPERYILLQAHYDAWFYGYWDNAIGVAGVLTIAKAILESGYQPHYTLLFVSPDAEEFGRPDTAYGWLYGTHKLIEAHPEWIGHMTCAFNIDTLAHRWQEGIQFVGCAEMLAFMRQVMTGYEVQHFPIKTVGVAEQITPWTEVFNYAYFGIPTIQPRFKTEGDPVRKLLYHTQFDDASVVDQNKAAEILKLYGHLLLQLDQQPIVPYNMVERVNLLATIEPALLDETQAQTWQESLAEFKQWATMLEIQKGRARQSLESAEAFSDYLRQIAHDLMTMSYYIESDFPDLSYYEHQLWQREWQALDKAIQALQSGQAHRAIEALTASHTGVQGGWYALNVSYPVYHRHIRHTDQPDLLWGAGRVIVLHDVWMELHTLQDKIRRQVKIFLPEITTLSYKRDLAYAGYQKAIQRVEQILQKVRQIPTP